MLERVNKVPEKPQIKGFRPMQKKDLPEVGELLSKYLNGFDAAPQFNKDELAHWIKPLKGVVSSFVVEDPETKKITDFGSYYCLPSSVIGHKVHKLLKAAYLFYYVTTKNSLTDLVRDLLVSAKNDEFDVFNCLDLLENQKFLEELKFGIGDGHLYYYLYNYKCPEIKPDKLGLVML